MMVKEGSYNRLVILQPGYLPWLGFFDMMMQADLFVFIDDVQYDKQSWRNRNRIKTKNGWTWLTVPVLLKGHHLDQIRNIKIDNSKKWMERHWNLIQENYRNAPFFKEYADNFRQFYQKKWEYLEELDLAIVDEFRRILNINTPLAKSSDIDTAGLKSQAKVIAICKHFGAKEYLNGPAGKAIYSEEVFAENGIRLIWHNYKHPVYPQQFGEFIPYMSTLDLVFNCGPDSREIIASGHINSASD